MKILVDMNLPPSWVQVLESHGHLATHWSSVGDGRASDLVILDWARDNGYLVFTHDLDFGAILAASQATAPSVVQVRTQDVTPAHLSDLLIGAIRQFETRLEQGALLTIDEARLRVRLLPLDR